MTEMDEASAHDNHEITEAVPEPAPIVSVADGDEVSDSASTPAEQAPSEPGQAVEPHPETAGGLTEDLRELRESIGQVDEHAEASEEHSASDAPTESPAAPVIEAAETPEATETAEVVDAAETPEATDSESLDDIAPGTVAEEAGSEAEAATGKQPVVATEVSSQAVAPAVLEAPASSVSWWPFVAYVMVWLGGAAYAVWQLQQLPTGRAAYETELYSLSVLGGLSLLAAGPFLLLIVWLASWIGRKGARVGAMFISALAKGATATMIGAIIWIAAIMLVDYLRLGRPY